METKDKELLLKDLCARLPYHPKCYCEWKEVAPNGTNGYVSELDTYLLEQFERCDEFDDIPITSVKPYLRPMSSMTEEEKSNYHNYRYWIEKGDIGHCTINMIDWLNAHHFDHRGLIPMGLALPAPDGMYDFK